MNKINFEQAVWINRDAQTKNPILERTESYRGKFLCGKIFWRDSVEKDDEGNLKIHRFDFFACNNQVIQKIEQNSRKELLVKGVIGNNIYKNKNGKMVKNTEVLVVSVEVIEREKKAPNERADINN